MANDGSQSAGVSINIFFVHRLAVAESTKNLLPFYFTSFTLKSEGSSTLTFHLHWMPIHVCIDFENAISKISSIFSGKRLVGFSNTILTRKECPFMQEIVHLRCESFRLKGGSDTASSQRFNEGNALRLCHNTTASSAKPITKRWCLAEIHGFVDIISFAWESDEVHHPTKRHSCRKSKSARWEKLKYEKRSPEASPKWKWTTLNLLFFRGYCGCFVGCSGCFISLMESLH